MAKKQSPQLDTVLMHTGLAPFHPDTGAAPVALPAMRTSTVRFRDLAAMVPCRNASGKATRGLAAGAGYGHQRVRHVLRAKALATPIGIVWHGGHYLALLALLDTGDPSGGRLRLCPIASAGQIRAIPTGYQVDYCRAIRCAGSERHRPPGTA